MTTTLTTPESSTSELTAHQSSNTALPNSLLAADEQWQLGPMAAWWHQVVATQRLAHGWVLRCPDTIASYGLGLVLAKVLNCLESPAPATACGQCRNCRWIDANAHPAVMTLSPRTLLVKEDTNDWPKLLRQKPPKFQKNIHATQVGVLESQLAYRSSDTRVVIICDADLQPELAVSNLPYPHELADVLGSEGNLNDHTFTPKPLTQRAMDASPTNKLLKTLEEPPNNCVFLFLTTHEDQLLDTIVSRCQVLALTAPVKASPSNNAELIDLFTTWATGGLGPRDNIDDHWNTLKNTVGDSPDWASVLTQWESTLHQQYRHNGSGNSAESNSNNHFRTYHAQLQAIETCRQQITAYVSPEPAIKQLLFYLCHELPR